jgi:hypothetical protein
MLSSVEMLPPRRAEVYSRRGERTEGRCIPRAEANRSQDPRLSATSFVCQNCDALKTGPRLPNLHNQRACDTLKRAAAKTPIRRNTSRVQLLTVGLASRMRLPSESGVREWGIH